MGKRCGAPACERPLGLFANVFEDDEPGESAARPEKTDPNQAVRNRMPKAIAEDLQPIVAVTFYKDVVWQLELALPHFPGVGLKGLAKQVIPKSAPLAQLVSEARRWNMSAKHFHQLCSSSPAKVQEFETFKARLTSWKNGNDTASNASRSFEDVYGFLHPLTCA